MRPYFDTEEKRLLLCRIAESWLGTPYSEKHFKKKVGTDCSRFLWQVWIEAGVDVNPSTQISRHVVGRGVGVHGDKILADIVEANQWVMEVESPCCGDISYLSGDRGYRHYVLHLTDDNIIHCDGRKGVEIRKRLEPKRMTFRHFRAWQS